MTLLEQRDAKAGFSTMCRRSDHLMCQTAGARCACSCHGTNGQTPPARPTRPEPQEAPPMPDTATAFHCDPCALDFPNAQGLGAHRRHKHPKANGGTPPQPAEKRPRPTPAAKATAVSDRQALAVLAAAYADLCGADVATSIESAGALLDAVTAAGWELTER